MSKEYAALRQAILDLQHTMGSVYVFLHDDGNGKAWKAVLSAFQRTFGEEFLMHGWTVQEWNDAVAKNETSFANALYVCRIKTLEGVETTFVRHLNFGQQVFASEE